MLLPYIVCFALYPLHAGSQGPYLIVSRMPDGRSCISSAPPSKASVRSRRAFSAQQEDDIREAVFRYELSLSGIRKLKNVYLDIDQHDPSDSFMKRFHRDGHGPQIKKISMGSLHTAGPGTEEVMRDNASNEEGVQLFLNEITRISPTKATVMGGYGYGLMDSARMRYYVEKKGRKWKVVKVRQISVS